MDDLALTRLIESENVRQAQWLREMDLSNAKAVDVSKIYRSTSITQLPMSLDMLDKSVSFKKAQTRETFLRTKSSFGFNYPSLKIIKSKDDPRPDNSSVATPYPLPPEVFRNTEFFGNGQKLKHDSYRTHGAFYAILDK
jgi:hypothetical protein